MISELCDVPFVMQNVHQPHIGHYFNYAEHVTVEKYGNISSPWFVHSAILSIK